MIFFFCIKFEVRKKKDFYHQLLSWREKVEVGLFVTTLDLVGPIEVILR